MSPEKKPTNLNIRLHHSASIGIQSEVIIILTRKYTISPKITQSALNARELANVVYDCLVHRKYLLSFVWNVMQTFCAAMINGSVPFLFPLRRRTSHISFILGSTRFRIHHGVLTFPIFLSLWGKKAWKINKGRKVYSEQGR